jgi:S1-C subfamily serine protease
MGVIWNPFNPIGIDFTGSGGGAAGPALRYVQTFNATTNWGTPSGGVYRITVLQTTHLKGINPNVQIYELVAGNYELVNVQSLIVNPSGDVSIEVPSSPDLRFIGIILII